MGLSGTGPAVWFTGRGCPEASGRGGAMIDPDLLLGLDIGKLGA